MIQELYLDVSRRNLNVSRRNLDVSRRKLNVSRKKLVQRVKKQEKTEAQFGNLKLAENCVIFKIKMIKIYVEKNFFLHVSILSTYFEWFVTFIMK